MSETLVRVPFGVAEATHTLSDGTINPHLHTHSGCSKWRFKGAGILLKSEARINSIL